jgi:hypothetical protein
MSFKIIGEAFELPLVGNDKLVFLALCENADDTTRTCYPSYKTIQRKASLANSSLATVLKVLEAVGLISIRVRSSKRGGRTSTLYKISEFDAQKFDVNNYKKIAKEIRTVRNFRKNKLIQPPKIDGTKEYPNLRNSTQRVEPIQPLKIDTVLDTQPPKFGEEPLAFSFEPLVLNTPQPPKEEAKGRRKLREKKNTPTLANIADQHHMTISAVEDYVEYRLNSGGIKNPTAFKKHLLVNLAELYSDESVQLEEWFNAFETQRDIIDHLVNEFLSMHWFDRTKCQEQAKDDLVLKMSNIVPSAVLIEIAFQTAEAKRRE